MDNAAILIKTDKGIEELALRSGAVPQKLRAILIMVDGKTRCDDLLNRYAGLPEFGEQLMWLVDNGFVAVAGKPAAAAAAATDRATFAPSTPGRAGLIEIAHHLLGAHAEKVIQRLQETDDARDALAQTMERCCKLIKLSIDEGKAEQFRVMGMKLLA